MKKILVNLSDRSYPIFVGVKLEGLGKYLKTFKFSSNALVVTNPTVGKLYASKVSGGLKRAGFKVSVVTISDGEKYKNLTTVSIIYSGMLKAGLDRRSVVIALGGGVVGDIAGYAAATFMRGLSVIQVPTTLLAMVDSSVGGKTGVDLREGKNLVGAFHQPKAVWIDLSALKTLPRNELRNGLAEIIKYGIIKDAALFKYLERTIAKMPGSFERVVAACAKIKAEVVSKDEFERKGLREILNYGHTFGHAVETMTNYRVYSHGEAVAIGMNIAARLAVRLKMLKAADAARIECLLFNAWLPTRIEKKLSADKILKAMTRDKKTLNGKLRLVLPVRIGKAVVKPEIPVETIKGVLR
jgi:3-dehydroquinate synthase